MKIAAAQIDLYPDLEKNLENIRAWAKKASDRGVDIVNFPEASLTGYLFEGFANVKQEAVASALDDLGGLSRQLGINMVVGTPYRMDDQLYNSVVVLLTDGRRLLYHKTHLVSYEQKYFAPGSEPLTFELGTLTLGTIICRDQDHPALAREVGEAGAKVLFISCAHYYPPMEARLKVDKNRALPIARALENRLFVCKANAIGSYRGRINLGHSMIVGPNGVVINEAGETQEELLTFDIDESRLDWR
ncbi:MAG: carbon-nitrogen hydrolase family protein [Desulfobacteraceae bacterium]|nr:carbon-nitrogen hydrolase family protein [Desulfobacteraceae bacterium]